ncbi:MAG: hypothetical protein ACOC0O_07205 [Spirochaetota bacterium]
MSRGGRHGFQYARAFLVPVCIVVALASASVGCTVPDRDDRRSPDLSARHTRVASLGSVDLTRIEAASLAGGGIEGEPDAILIGDVSGNAADEFVVVRSGGFAVYSSDGTLRTTVPAVCARMSGGALIDHDGDGKLDVVTGTARGTDPVVNVHNGRGLRIGGFRLFDDNSAFAALRPSALMAGDLLVIATENWPAGARGVFRLSDPSLEVRWFAAVPTAVTGVAVAGDLTLVSNDIQSNGEYARIGTGPDVRFGFDAQPQVLALSAEGLPVVEQALPVSAGAEHAPVWLVPAGAREVLIHEEGLNRLSFSRITEDGELRMVPVDLEAGTEITQVAVHDGGFALVALRADGWIVVAYDEEATYIRSWEGEGAAPRVVATFADANEPLSYLVARAGGLAALDETGVRSVFESPSLERPLRSAVAASRDDAAIVLVGADATLLRIPVVPAPVGK